MSLFPLGVMKKKDIGGCPMFPQASRYARLSTSLRMTGFRPSRRKPSRIPKRFQALGGGGLAVPSSWAKSETRNSSSISGRLRAGVRAVGFHLAKAGVASPSRVLAGLTSARSARNLDGAEVAKRCGNCAWGVRARKSLGRRRCRSVRSRRSALGSEELLSQVEICRTLSPS